MKTSLRDWRRIVREATAGWNRHSAQTLSAAMAFYVLVSVAPLSVIAVGIAGRALGEAEVRAHVQDTSDRLLDPVAAQLLAEILETPWVRRSNAAGNAIAILILGFASTAGFNHLRTSLNRIFGGPKKAGGAVKGLLRGRALAFLVVVIVGVTIVASLVIRTALVVLDAAVDQLWVSELIPLPTFVVLEALAILAVLTTLFAIVMRILPDRKLGWRSLMAGASTTSVLFMLGEWLIGQYLGRVALASAFGVAGSSVVLAVWVYYSSMVFLFGASLTRAYAEVRSP